MNGDWSLPFVWYLITRNYWMVLVDMSNAATFEWSHLLWIIINYLKNARRTTQPLRNTYTQVHRTDIVYFILISSRINNYSNISTALVYIILKFHHNVFSSYVCVVVSWTYIHTYINVWYLWCMKRPVSQMPAALRGTLARCKCRKTRSN